MKKSALSGPRLRVEDSRLFPEKLAKCWGIFTILTLRFTAGETALPGRLKAIFYP
jgi:hypothetical protein